MTEGAILNGHTVRRPHGALAYLAWGGGRTVLHGWTPHTGRTTPIGHSIACRSIGRPAPLARRPDESPASTRACPDAGSGSASGTHRPYPVRSGGGDLPCPYLPTLGSWFMWLLLG